MVNIRNRDATDLVFVDTNILFTPDKKEIVSSDFKDFYNEYSDQFNLKLMIPEVVKGELKYQITKHALNQLKTANSSIKKIANVTNTTYKHKITEERIKRDIEKKFLKWIKEYKAEIIPTPIKSINWANIITNSIWRVPPFEETEKNEEKGFRDALILETISNFCNEVDVSQSVSFITRDGLLRDAAEEEITKYNFSIYESLPDFKSTLDLKKQNLESIFIKNISHRASLKFFRVNDQKSLYYRDNIWDKIYEKYRNEIEKPEQSIKHESALVRVLSTQSYQEWFPATNHKLYILRPTFVKVENKNEYFWLSIITFVKKYRRSNPVLNTLVENQDLERIQILPFHVNWKSRVSKNGKFLEYKYIDIELKNAEFRMPTEEDERRWDF